VALTDEQRTMLQLLLEGGQGYEDIGSLLGIGPDEVRTRARSALREMAGTDPDAQVPLSDYLLGQADPIGRADAVRQMQSDPEANAVAARLVQQLRLLAPKAQLPEIPEPRGARAPAPAAPPPPPTAAPGTPPPTPRAPAAPRGPGLASRAATFFSRLGGEPGKRRPQLIAAMVAGLALVVAIVVITTGGDGGGNSDCAPLDTSQAQQAGIPTAGLSAVGAAADADCAPTGQVTLIPLSPQNQQSQNQSQTSGFALQTNAAHLDPSASGDVYVLWLYQSDSQARPLGQETVDSSGNLNGAAALPAQQLPLLQALPSIRLSRVTQAQNQQIQQSLQAQGKNATGVVAFLGTPVLEGSATDLLQQLQQLLQQAQSQAGGGTGTTPAPQGGAGNKQAG
jgi:hypothetical protein